MLRHTSGNNKLYLLTLEQKKSPASIRVQYSFNQPLIKRSVSVNATYSVKFISKLLTCLQFGDNNLWVGLQVMSFTFYIRSIVKMLIFKKRVVFECTSSFIPFVEVPVGRPKVTPKTSSLNCIAQI